ncbi:MAG: MDR family MFS transporter [Peptococcaceae bacterium]|nr:MDR family MFS transporter [Peptococcaceae bacterium]
MDTQAKTNRPLVLTAIILAMFMSAIEATIVATAMPSIVGELGGFALFSWVFSIFLLMQAVTIPIYGKLADLFGRKPVFVVGVIVFLFGSLLCGLAHSMSMLILFRLIQGLGAGSVQPIVTTIVGDIYSVQERAKVQGYLSSVWGISSVAGPAVGGVMVQYISWSWVFWLNIPLGILAIVGIVRYLHEDITKKQHKIDYLGACLLLTATGLLMVAMIEGGVGWPWLSMPSLLLMLTFALTLYMFIRQELRAEEPIVPLRIWRNRLIAVANAASLTTGIVMIGISTFLPTFVQGVMEKSPTIAGLTLGMMSIGWPLASTLAGKLLLSAGVRKTALLGGIILVIGSVFFVTLQPAKGPVWAGVGAFFIGAGLGLATTTFIVAIQSSVEWSVRGTATASNMFMRILGNTLGASLLGGILNSGMGSYLKGLSSGSKAPLSIDFTDVLLDPAKRAALPASLVNVLQRGLTSSLHYVYWGVAVFAVLSLGIIFLLPKESLKEMS